ncbi:hypothetical protein M2418_000426 [Rhizobium sp. BIGb0125]|uniref:hypothetical protein n=1 Tax=Rhizobium sp. BIGb0125 TaxID=2940618 RepID=UPI0021697BED|nr:hypothetical protein [Rhizobium sp. BIGb0125]MCS4240924.1 hypothetical protein [Rhizobium sp. BIGb0125]
MLEKIVFALAGVGVAAIATGVTYAVNFEGRISKLEAQSNFTLGVSAVSNTSTTKTAPDTKDQVSQNGLDILHKAIASSCAKLSDTFNEIVSAGTIYSSEKDRLEALTAQMAKMNCVQTR